MNVDRIARAYRWIEYAAFGRALERCRFAFVAELQSANRILIVGEGDGRFLQRLLAANSHARVDVVELSSRMVELSCERLRAADSERVCFQSADVRTVDLPSAYYDAVVTNFVLDCFSEEDIRVVIEKLRRSISATGVWIVSEFQRPTRGWRRVWAELWLAVMYTFFRVSTGLRVCRLPSYSDVLRERGLVLAEQKDAWSGLMSSALWRPRR